MINFAGLPPTTVHGSTSLKTQPLAPTTAPSPTVTPGPTNASAATQALSSITIGFSICGCVGLVISCGVIFIRFYFDTSIKTSEEIENKLGLTVLGIVPKVEKE